jgi:hypothetical protein
MQKVKLPWQGFVVCAVWACGLPLLQGAVTSQASQPTQDETAAKPKRHSKKPADATSPQTTLPGETGEKTSRTRRAKAPASDVTPSNSANRAMTSEGKTATPAKNASSAEIQAAKASGQVWVNTNSGVYHKGGRWYGATKEGKFMSEQDAVKAGYKEAKNEK